MGHNPNRARKRTLTVSRGVVAVTVEPSDHAAVLVSAISKAKVSVRMTMYLLSAVEVVNALLERAKAGVVVEVILNQKFSPLTPASNDKVFATLTAGGVKVVWAPSKFVLTHAKYVSIDAKEAWIMTMNATTTALKENREFLVRTTQPALVADVEKIFAGDFAGTPIPTYAGPLVVSPLNSKAILYDLIGKAKKTIDIEGEELSDAGFVLLLSAAAARNVVVRIVLSDRAPSSAGKKANDSLTAVSIKTVTVKKPYIHSKAIVIDGKTAYVGSQNFTHASITENREMGIILTAKAAVGAIAKTIDADFAIGTPRP